MVWFRFVLKKRAFTYFPFSKNQGQSLVELIAATAVLLLIITGVIIATNRSVKNSDFSKMQALATKYAQEGMENVRNLRETNPVTFWTKTGIETETIQSGTVSFTRETTYVPNAQKTSMQITVVVKWQDASGRHQADQRSVLTNSKQW